MKLPRDFLISAVSGTCPGRNGSQAGHWKWVCFLWDLWRLIAGKSHQKMATNGILASGYVIAFENCHL